MAGREGDASAAVLAVAGFLAACRTANTRAAYGADLGHLAAWCAEQGRIDLLSIDAEDLARYQTACELAGASPATMARRLSAITSFGAFSGETGRQAALVSSDIVRPRVGPESRTGLLSDDEAAALLQAADQIGERSGVLVRLLMLDGLKVSEVCSADAADVRGRPPRMLLELHKPRPRTVALHSDTGRALRRYVGDRQEGPLLLSEQRGRSPGRLTRFGIDYLVKQVANAAGISHPISSNVLRRRFVMAAHADGTDLDEIRSKTGHAQSRTTRRYLDAPDDQHSVEPVAET